MKVLISGASGFIGSHLTTELEARGHSVLELTRSPVGNARRQIRWSPAEGTIDHYAIADASPDAVVHLAGESIDGRWTKKKRRRIMNSRVEGTKLLAETVARLETKPKLMISSSAVGYYGSRGRQEIGEAAGPGEGFLAEVCVQWEKAAEPARDAGIRVVHPRFGVVLGGSGGMLAKVLPLFKLGLGGTLGSGDQMMSWVHIGDVVGALQHMLDDGKLTGPVNVTSPHPVSNREFTRTLADVLKRPAVFKVPAFALKLALGQQADDMLLTSQKILPQELERVNYSFAHPLLEMALRDLLGRRRKT